MIYCVREQRGPDNPGSIPCPDVDRCHLCGKQNQDEISHKVSLSEKDWKTVLSSLEELTNEYQEIIDATPDEQKEHCSARMVLVPEIRDIVQKIKNQIE